MAKRTKEGDGYSRASGEIDTVSTEIGTIATTWRIAPLEALCEPPQYGYTASAGEKGNVRLLRITDITESGVEWPSVPFCECPPELLHKYRLTSGDIVFTRIGATTGKSYLITNPPPSVFASYLIRVRAKQEIDPVFLSQFFRSEAYWRQIDAQKNANLKKGVSGSLLKALLVPIPPLPEQRKIAGVLGVVQRAMEQQERLLALTAELKKTLLHQLFTKGLRGEPQKQTEIGPVPQSWEVIELGSLASKISKGSSPRWQGFEYLPEGVLFIRSQNVGPGRMEFADRVFLSSKFNEHEKRSILKDGDILINLVGASIGRAALGTAEIEGANCNQAVGFVRIQRERSFKEFIVNYLLSPVGQQQMFFQKKDIVRANLSLLDLRTFKVPVPSPAESDEIAAVFAKIENKLDFGQRKRAALTTLFRTLLHQLMTAQIRVHDLGLPKLGEAMKP
jgi:type I restriction enzyme, S subunit